MLQKSRIIRINSTIMSIFVKIIILLNKKMITPRYERFENDFRRLFCLVDLFYTS